MDDEPLWLTFEDVVEVHADQLRSHGGLAGVKDANLVHSAIAAPRNLFLYEGQEDVIALAVKLCLALAKNHGFADGNKRTATAAMIEFLLVNGYGLVLDDDDPDEPVLGSVGRDAGAKRHHGGTNAVVSPAARLQTIGLTPSGQAASAGSVVQPRRGIAMERRPDRSVRVTNRSRVSI